MGLKLSIEVVEKGPLTVRQMRVFVLWLQGESRKRIADQLGISIKTVEHHIENIWQRIGTKKQAIALRHAEQSGWIRTVVKNLCFVLAVGAVWPGDEVRCATRLRLPRPPISRLRREI